MLSDMSVATSPQFIGRAEELARLAEVLERAEQGRRAVAVIGGEAGVGKTRLLGVVADRAAEQGARVLIGGCMETGDLGLPYVPFVDAFSVLGTGPEDAHLIQELVAAVPNLGRLLPSRTEERGHVSPPSDAFEQVELFGGIASLLIRLSESAPVLLVIEDLHWADRSTRDLLAFLVRTLRSGRIALVASYRSDELHRRHPLRPFLTELFRMSEVERIDLQPFDRADLAAHLEAILGEAVDGAIVDQILARSDGNAFFSEELIAAGAISDHVVLPGGLADVLRTRIEALSDQAQELLKVAAVAGRRVSHQLLLAASEKPEEELEPLLRETVTGQVLVADASTETYRFRHALLQETVYSDLLPGERNRLHSTYARLLADSGAAAELAHHCLASHDLPGALAALMRAATEAGQVSAPAEAFSHLIQAVELWDQVPDAATVANIERPALLLKAATAAGNSGEFRRAVGLAQEAVDAIDATKDPISAGLAYERLGEHVYVSDGSEQEALSILRRAVELVPEDPPIPERARVTAGLARALAGYRHYEEARKWANEALEVARKVDDPDDETNALNTLSTLELRADNPESARSLLAEAGARAGAVGARNQELRALFGVGSLELDVGDLEAACKALQISIDHAARYGLLWSQYGINSRVLRAFAHYAVGKWDEVMRFAAALDESMPGVGSISSVALFVEVGRGDPNAHDRLAKLEIQWDENDWVAYLAGGSGADLALWDGDIDTALVRARRSLSGLAGAEEAWELAAIWPATLGIAAEAERAELARLAGDDRAVAEAIKEGEEFRNHCLKAEEVAHKIGRQIGPEARAWLARSEAEWSRLKGEPDPDLWAAAADAFSYGYMYEEARCRWRLAEALLATGRREEAEEPARAAIDVAKRVGAEPLRSRIEALARRGRLDVGQTESSDPMGAGLTPRELEVLRLVAAGRSNQQIADELFISRKTASVHVSHILGKLDVQTRGEAAAAAHRLGIDEV